MRAVRGAIQNVRNGQLSAPFGAYQLEIPMSETYAINDYFKKNGLISEEEYFELYKQSVEDNEGFWAEQAQIVERRRLERIDGVAGSRSKGRDQPCGARLDPVGGLHGGPFAARSRTNHEHIRLLLRHRIARRRFDRVHRTGDDRGALLRLRCAALASREACRSGGLRRPRIRLRRDDRRGLDVRLRLAHGRR